MLLPIHLHCGFAATTQRISRNRDQDDASFGHSSHVDFDTDRLMDAKGETSITVALPARNEAATIGPILETIRTQLIDAAPLIDELLVIDDGSTDDTAAIAADAGATVLAASSILPDFGPSHGKGEALWKSLYASRGDLICWCDADIENYDNRFIVGPLGPLLTNPSIGFCKGFYDRPLRSGVGGGRVTELMARPLISALFPRLGGIIQPLSGEFAGRRTLLEQVPFSRGYAVDLALLIDLSERFGVEVIAQVDLGSRIHDNRPLSDLGAQSTAILGMALDRSEAHHVGDTLELLRPGSENVRVAIGDRPPLVSLSSYPPA